MYAGLTNSQYAFIFHTTHVFSPEKLGCGDGKLKGTLLNSVGVSELSHSAGSWFKYACSEPFFLISPVSLSPPHPHFSTLCHYFLYKPIFLFFMMLTLEMPYQGS